MAEYEDLVREEIAATIDRAGFENVHPDALHVEVTESFQRKLGQCRPVQQSDHEAEVGQYMIRIARRLFEQERDEHWRDTVRHEVAHASILTAFGQEVPTHGKEWKAAARRAGADPNARYEGEEDLVDADYVLACPNGCFERGYLKRSRRIKKPWLYTCGECDSRLISYDAGDKPLALALEPGTCYVSSISRKSSADRDERRQTAPYLLACPNGCVTWPYQQRAKRIKQPWLYVCPDCDTTLLSCDGGEQPTALDAGTCNVASIPWQTPRFVHACPNGCFSVGYGHHCEETRQPDRYRCEDCGARTVVYPVDDRPAILEPGTSYVE